jgi:predicted GIY-YIG superfamily endonuclease
METNHGTVYVLQLEHNKYYVGHTKEKDLKRIVEHGNGRASAQWTRLYKPISILRTMPGSTMDEDRMALHAMEVYGWCNVRGGKWCIADMKNPPRELQKNNLLQDQDECKRCCRTGHTDRMCLWDTDVWGDAIFS